MNGKYGLRVGANVRWLYLKLAIETVTELVAARILLSALGVDGFGLFAAATGSVGAFAFFMGALEGAARRFVCCDRHNFAPFLGLTLALVGVLGLVCGVVASVFLPYALAISFSVLGALLVRLLRIPYETCFVADERMGFFLVVTLIESMLTIMVPLFVGCFPFDPVVVYATLRFLSSIAIGVLVVGWCFKRHPISRMRPQFRWVSIRPILGFFSWHALGALAGLLKGNGIVILLAAYAGAVGCAACDAGGRFGVLFWGVIANYRMAYLPGIVKAWADRDWVAFVSVTKHIFWRSVIGMTLLLFPFLMFAPEICRACLGATLPEHTAMFARMVALQFYFEALATPFDTAILATGRIALYGIALTALIGSSFFFAWAFLAAGLPAWVATGTVALVNAFEFLYRFVHLKMHHGIAIRAWFSLSVV